MVNIAKKLESEIQKLNPKEKAALAHYLIEELDGGNDAGVEGAWRKEAESRYQAFTKRTVETISGKEAMRNARERLK